MLPVPALNVINGGSHAGNKLAMQEFMLLPTGATSFREALQIGTEVYHDLKNVIKAKYGLGRHQRGRRGRLRTQHPRQHGGPEPADEAISQVQATPATCSWHGRGSPSSSSPTKTSTTWTLRPRTTTARRDLPE